MLCIISAYFGVLLLCGFVLYWYAAALDRLSCLALLLRTARGWRLGRKSMIAPHIKIDQFNGIDQLNSPSLQDYTFK
jgi:hypothetical protein